jgi:hypothetical protein
MFTADALSEQSFGLVHATPGCFGPLLPEPQAPTTIASTATATAVRDMTKP